MSNNPDVSRLALITRGDLHQSGVVTRVSAPAGAVLASFAASTDAPEATKYTVQSGETAHINLAPDILRFINHSCAPNVYFDVDARQVVSLVPVCEGDELTFFYPSTEWSMASPFACACGAPTCAGTINGARHMPAAALAGQRLAPHIQRLLAAHRG